jgi:hypothetical protein
MPFRRTRRQHVTDYYNVIHAQPGSWYRNFLYLARSRSIERESQSFQILMVPFTYGYYLMMRPFIYDITVNNFTQFCKLIVFPAALVSTLLSAIMAWVQVYNEYKITKHLRKPTFVKAIIETLIFMASGTAVLGGVLAGNLFLPIITPILLSGSFALKGVLDLATAAGHCYRIFLGNVTPAEKRENIKSALLNLANGLINTAAVVSTVLLLLSPLNFALPLAIAIFASAAGSGIALLQSKQGQYIDLVKTTSSTLQALNGLDINPKVRYDLVYGLRTGELRTELPTVVEVAMNPVIAPPVPVPQMPVPHPVNDPAAGQQPNGAFHLGG